MFIVSSDLLTIIGEVVKRSEETINKNLQTGEIEIQIEDFKILSNSEVLPLPVNSDIEYGEEIRLKYRFLDLRRNKLHKNIILLLKIMFLANWIF